MLVNAVCIKANQLRKKRSKLNTECAILLLFV